MESYKKSRTKLVLSFLIALLVVIFSKIYNVGTAFTINFWGFSLSFTDNLVNLIFYDFGIFIVTVFVLYRSHELFLEWEDLQDIKLNGHREIDYFIVQSLAMFIIVLVYIILAIEDIRNLDEFESWLFRAIALGGAYGYLVHFDFHFLISKLNFSKKYALFFRRSFLLVIPLSFLIEYLKVDGDNFNHIVRFFLFSIFSYAFFFYYPFIIFGLNNKIKGDQKN